MCLFVCAKAPHAKSPGHRNQCGVSNRIRRLENKQEVNYLPLIKAKHTLNGEINYKFTKVANKSNDMLLNFTRKRTRWKSERDAKIYTCNLHLRIREHPAREKQQPPKKPHYALTLIWYKFEMKPKTYYNLASARFTLQVVCAGVSLALARFSSFHCLHVHFSCSSWWWFSAMKACTHSSQLK